MSGSKVVLMVLLLFVGAIVLGGGCAGCTMYSSYKTSINLDEEVKAQWADIDVVLKRRYDLIPNFVATVKGAAAHEKETLQGVIAARNQTLNAKSPGEVASASNAFSQAAGRFINVVNERYPQLRATEQFQNLTISLEGSENRIAQSRKKYNAAVKALNSHIRGFPHSIAAGWADVEKAEFFEAEEEAHEVPKVEFG